MVTPELTERLEQARQRERAARARVARLRRELDGANRRLANRRKYIIGSAVIALAESGRAESMVVGLRGWLARYLTRDQDREALRGTAFDLSGEGERA